MDARLERLKQAKSRSEVRATAKRLTFKREFLEEVYQIALSLGMSLTNAEERMCYTKAKRILPGFDKMTSDDFDRGCAIGDFIFKYLESKQN